MKAPDGKHWPWGPIKEVHTIGDYEVVEFTWKTSGDLNGKVGFSPFVSGKDTGQSAPTLDGALLIAISSKAKNSGAAPYIAKMLGLETN